MAKLAAKKVLLIPFLVGFVSTATARDKSDVLLMKNGDRITCEIVSLGHGQLLIKTDYSIGKLTFDWNEVASIESPHEFVIDTRDGVRLIGEIQKAPETPGKGGTFIVANRKLAFASVVGLTQTGRSFLSSWTGSISGGFNIATASDQTQYTASADATYNGRLHQLKATAASTFNSLSGAPSIARNNLTFTHIRFLPRSWLIGELLDLLRSDEQQLNLRTIVGGFGGRLLLRSNTSVAAVYGGAAFSNEAFRPQSGEDSRRNLDALVGGRIRLWRFDSTEFSSEIRIYPNLTTLGRFRADLNSYVKLDIIGNLFVKTNFFGNYQSAPPQNTHKLDLGLSTSVGWSF